MRKAARMTGIIVALSALAIGLILFLSLVNTNFYEIDRSPNIAGSGLFKIYNGQIYALVPGNGYYPMADADPDTFISLGDSFDSRQIAKDASQVYCGNQALPQLQSRLTSHIGNGYLSDGFSAYYCSRFTVPNQELSVWRHLWEQAAYSLGRPSKPQTYYYPYQQLRQIAKTLRPLLESDLATDGVRVFYRGLSMPGANPATIHRMRSIDDGRTGESDMYFADGENVFFQNLLLPLKDQTDVFAFQVSTLSDEPYLVVPTSGIVYIGAKAFPAEYAPYAAINDRREHANHVLFAGSDGLFFYDTQEQALKRAGNNPMAAGGFKRLSPFVYSNGEQTLFLNATEVWSGTGRRTEGGLISRSTVIRSLQTPNGSKWRKIGDVYHDFGSVWESQGILYYFDNLGNSQFLNSAIYRIADPKTANFLVNSMQTMDISAEDIRNFLRNGSLIVPPSEDILNVTTCPALLRIFC